MCKYYLGFCLFYVILDKVNFIVNLDLRYSFYFLLDLKVIL